MLLSMTLDGDASTWSNGASLPRDRSALHASEYERRDESLLITSSAASPSMQGARDVHTGERNRAPSAQWPDEGGISKQRYHLPLFIVVVVGGRGVKGPFFSGQLSPYILTCTRTQRGGALF
jgi:hypothetical protein